MSVEIEGVRVHSDRAGLVIGTCLTARTENRQVFSEEISPPEARLIRHLVDYSKEIKDERFPLNALFLITGAVRGGRTRPMLQKAGDLERLRALGWIFQPEKVLVKDEEEILEACRNFLSGAGYGTAAFKNWPYNCRLLQEKYRGDIRNFFSANGNEAREVIKKLVVAPRAKTERKINAGAFLSYGPKLARLFVQWVNQYGLYELTKADQIGLPIDWQIGRLMIQTGATETDRPIQAHTFTQVILLPLLTELCEDKGWNQQKVSETLWLIGSLCCSTRRHRLCPLEEMCDRLISSVPYYRGGMFDPTDIGRFPRSKESRAGRVKIP